MASALPRIVYRATHRVPSGGMRVRRGPSLGEVQVGSIERGVLVGTGEVRSYPAGRWAKVHPCMEGELQGSSHYSHFDLAREGWVALELEGEVYMRAGP